MTKLPVIIALNNVRSLHNVGAIFRSADAVNAERIILGGLTPVPPRHEIEKTALGATKTVAWEYCKDLRPKLLELKKKGYSIYALEQSTHSQDIFLTALNHPAVLVVGHEREGVENTVLNLCDAHLHIPMLGKSAHSLNVSTATTVALYQFIKPAL
jgi:23S rRNA (guanosine2251-2'-O)-methyltransferase